MSEIEVNVKPVRCLFESLENKQSVLQQREVHSQALKQQVNQACQCSVERFRHVYNFDVQTVQPVNKSTEFDQNENTEGGFVNKLTCSDRQICCNHNIASWHWEAVSLSSTYVPKFYHAVRYHSDGCLHEHINNRDQLTPVTPKKRINVSPHMETADQKVERSVCTESLNVSYLKEVFLKSTKTPSLFHVWRARVRRASYSDSTPKSACQCSNDYWRSDTKHSVRVLRPNPSSCCLNRAVRVPNPSPVKPQTDELSSSYTRNKYCKGADLIQGNACLSKVVGDSHTTPAVMRKLHQLTLPEMFKNRNKKEVAEL